MTITKYLQLKNLLPKVEGPVLNGQISLKNRVTETAAPDKVQRRNEFYQSTDDYDPVLRAHTRR